MVGTTISAEIDVAENVRIIGTRRQRSALRALPSFVGGSQRIRSLLDEAEVAAHGGNRPVLIRGPIGAGKTLLARHVHSISDRANQPIVVLDCGGPSLENALVGHRRGSFTGADRDFAGRLRQADGGVLVLDDFDRLSPSVQDQLHHFIVDGVFQPLGADTEEEVDVRIFATTNKDVDQLVAHGELKADFVSRLDYFVISVPALDEHTEDIPVIAQSLLEQNLASQNRASESDRHLQFAPECAPLLRRLRFPDNARGLDKLIVRLIATTRGREVILPRDLEAAKKPSRLPPARPWFDQPRSLRKAREAEERRHILAICQETGFNLSEAARILEISRKSLYAKLKQYGIARP